MNKKFVSALGFVLLGLILLTVFSCHPQKKITREPIKDKRADSLFGLLKKNEFKFNYLSIKFSADVSFNKNNNSFNGNVRIKKDSAIWISITPALGLEAARILITIDTVKMINRLASTYFIGDFKYINSLLKTDLDYDMLQSLLVGNDFSSYENDVFKASIDNKQYLLSTVGRGKLKKHLKNTEDSSRILMQDIWLDPETYKITRVHIKELQENKKLEAEYSDFATVNSLLFPNKIEFVVVNEKTRMEIKIENSKVSTTGPLEFPFNISSKYNRINY
jgi:outer membrane lipoprotein-sorting protein